MRPRERQNAGVAAAKNWMQDLMRAGRGLAVILGTVLAASLPGHAGPIDAACLSSGRDEANRTVCACVQQVADQTLDNADQRRAARFFRDPELAHKTMMSQSARDTAFWARWESFGAQAELYCTPEPPPQP
jgi:hypothetical protein